MQSMRLLKAAFPRSRKLVISFFTTPSNGRIETGPMNSRSGKPKRKLPPYAVRKSKVHGNGVFARRKIPAGEKIIEYRGERIEWEEALDRAERKGAPPNHTFFFSVADGRVIDGGSRGNAARFINHSCEPNCEPLEHEDGRVYIYSLREIERGEELSYYYALIYEDRHTAALKRAFPCYCGSPDCAGTMLAPKKGKPT